MERDEGEDGMKVDKFPGVVEMVRGKRNVLTYCLSDEQLEWLRRWYPVLENGRLMEMSGLKHATLHRFAKENGLQKSEAGMRGIIRRQARKAKAINEASGYYASLRGKRPSDATLAGAARMWERIRAGEILSPLESFRKKHPRLYKKRMEEASERRKQLVAKERRRLMLGLPQLTDLKIIRLQKYTRRQVMHRFYALKMGYIVMADCSEQSGERWNIYYDDETKRGERFERNLKKDGFNVLRIDD